MEATAIQTNTANVQEATISLALIQPSNYNPVRISTKQSLTELADSISRQGILHAIGVRDQSPALTATKSCMASEDTAPPSSQGKRHQGNSLYRPFR